MPIVRTDIPDLLLAGMRTEFALAYKRQMEQSVVPQIASVIPTTLPTQNYGWLGNVPAMREWLGERRIKALAEYPYSISDKTWESTLGVKRTALEDDQYGMIQMRTQDLALEAARHQEQLVVQALALGATTACYDGQYLIDTDHREGIQTADQNNKSTSPLAADTLSLAISTMMQFVDDQNVPMGIVPDTLVVGPKLKFIAMELLQSTINVTKVGAGSAGTGATAAANYLNVLNGVLKNLIVSPYLTGTYDDYWFLLDTSRAIRSVILQTRSDVPVEFSALDNPNTSSPTFMRDELLYGVRARYNVGYGLWQTVYGGIL